MIHQRVRQLQPSRQEVQIAALGARLRVDGQARGRVKLNALRLGLSRRDQRVDIDRGAELVGQEILRFRVHAGHSHLVADLGFFGIRDMPVRPRGGDHGAHQNEGEFLVGGGWVLKWRPTAARSGPARRSARRARRRSCILVRLVAERRDGGEAAQAQAEPVTALPAPVPNKTAASAPAASGLSLAIWPACPNLSRTVPPTPGTFVPSRSSSIFLGSNIRSSRIIAPLWLRQHRDGFAAAIFAQPRRTRHFFMAMTAATMSLLVSPAACAADPGQCLVWGSGLVSSRPQALPQAIALVWPKMGAAWLTVLPWIACASADNGVAAPPAPFRARHRRNGEGQRSGKARAKREGHGRAP